MKHARQLAEVLLRDAAELVRQARIVEDACRQSLIEAVTAEHAQSSSDSRVQPVKRPPPRERLLTFSELLAEVGLEASTVYRMMDAGTFPMPVFVGPTVVHWRRTDIDLWQSGRAGRDAPAA